MATDPKLEAVVSLMIDIYRRIKAINRGSHTAIIRSSHVTDDLTGLMFAFNAVGETLGALGGPALMSRAIRQLEDTLDDVDAAVFASRRWNGTGGYYD